MELLVGMKLMVGTLVSLNPSSTSSAWIFYLLLCTGIGGIGGEGYTRHGGTGGITSGGGGGGTAAACHSTPDPPLASQLSGLGLDDSDDVSHGVYYVCVS